MPVPANRPSAYSDDGILLVRELSHSGEPAVVLSKGWLEKMRKHLQVATAVGTAEGSGEDFHQKILDRETPVSVQVFLAFLQSPIYHN